MDVEASDVKQQMDMEASDLAIKTSELVCEKQAVTHGSSPKSPSRNARPVFLPKQPARPRQRGALPRTFSEEMASSAQHAGVPMQSLAQHISGSLAKPSPRRFTQETTSPLSQQEACLKPPPEEAWQGQLSSQHGMVHPQQQGSLIKRKKQAPLPQRGGLPNAGKVSKSWHRVSPQESSYQRGELPPAQEQSCKPRQQGAMHPSFQGQGQASLAQTSSSQGSPVPPLSVAKEPRAVIPFLEIKSSFSEMWFQLEGAIESRERMILGMKTDMEKSLSQVKIVKDAALKEREEVQAKKAGVMENLELIREKTGKVKSVREGLEHISTDLSVQVAELKHLLQQVQEQQRVLKVLESLKDQHDAANDRNSFVNRNLQQCEVKLATMERELAASKQASELLEKASLKRIGDLQDIEAGSGLPISLANSASSKFSVVQSMSQTNTYATENFSKTRVDASPSGLNGEQDVLGHIAALKQPKLEAVS